MLNIICLDFWNTMYENIPQNPKRTYIYNLIYNSFNKKISTNKIISLLNEFDKAVTIYSIAILIDYLI